MISFKHTFSWIVLTKWQLTFIHSFNTYLLSIYYAPDIGCKGTVNKTEGDSHPSVFTFQCGEEDAEE